MFCNLNQSEITHDDILVKYYSDDDHFGNLSTHHIGLDLFMSLMSHLLDTTLWTLAKSCHSLKSPT